MRALDVGTSFDLGLENVGGLGPLGAFAGETDKLKRLDEIMSCLDVSLLLLPSPPILS